MKWFLSVKKKKKKNKKQLSPIYKKIKICKKVPTFPHILHISTLNDIETDLQHW